MKKKILSMLTCLLAFVLSLTAFTACGKKGNNKNIVAVVREDGSGTKSAFMEILGLKGKSDVDGAIVGYGTAGMLTAVKNNSNAIGYDSLGYVTSEVKILTVNGVAPSSETIKNGTYKISRPLSIVYQEAKLTNNTNKKYLEFLKSSEAQTIISENGYITNVDNATNYVPEEGLSGQIDLSGSTSLQPLMEKLAAKFEALQSGVKVTVAGGGSGTGYNNAKKGVGDFGMISETFNSAKADNCTYYTVALDGIAIIVNKKNNINDISLDNLKGIFNKDDQIKTWDKI
ncbi:MAG TPA: phosphate ABC transporter substrate-binding protein [Clostridiales bacterium]|nr:phosphate ABC transporter substrate-binding protein [Clostridiales bacterium]